MAKHESLIARLCEASEGSAELSAEVWTALTGLDEYRVNATWFTPQRVRIVEQDGQAFVETTRVECLTTSLSAAWAEAKREGLMPCLDMLDDGNGFQVHIWDAYGVRAQMIGKHEACTLCAAILAAEGER